MVNWHCNLKYLTCPDSIYTLFNKTENEKIQYGFCFIISKAKNWS